MSGWTTATTIAVAAAVASASVSAYAAYESGQSQKKAADYNAEMQRRAADDALQRGAISAAEHREKVRSLVAKQEAAGAAGGLDTGSGSMLKTMVDTAGMGELDALRIQNNAQREASGLQAEAINTQYLGRAAARTGALNAGASLLSGASNAVGSYYSVKANQKASK